VVTYHRSSHVEVQRLRSAVYLAVSGGKTTLREIHVESKRIVAQVRDKTAVDRALQWWRRRGTIAWSKDRGWVVIKPEGAMALVS
jgi:hypothetical protein